jgi:hypothetical protein
MAVLAPLIAGRAQDSLVFLNRYGAPVTRFGIHTPVERHAKHARESVQSLAKKRVRAQRDSSHDGYAPSTCLNTASLLPPPIGVPGQGAIPDRHTNRLVTHQILNRPEVHSG